MEGDRKYEQRQEHYEYHDRDNDPPRKPTLFSARFLTRSLRFLKFVTMLEKRDRFIKGAVGKVGIFQRAMQPGEHAPDSGCVVIVPHVRQPSARSGDRAHS